MVATSWFRLRQQAYRMQGNSASIASIRHGAKVHFQANGPINARHHSNIEPVTSGWLNDWQRIHQRGRNSIASRASMSPIPNNQSPHLAIRNPLMTQSTNGAGETRSSIVGRLPFE